MILFKLRPDIDRQHWHDWFAWRPVVTEVENEVVWLEWMQRRITSGVNGLRYRYYRRTPVRDHLGRLTPRH